MPCDAIYQRLEQEAEKKRIEAERKAALDKLEALLRAGEVGLEYDRVSGKLVLRGWLERERVGWQDGCALAALSARGCPTLQERLVALGATEETVRLTHGH